MSGQNPEFKKLLAQAETGGATLHELVAALSRKLGGAEGFATQWQYVVNEAPKGGTVHAQMVKGAMELFIEHARQLNRTSEDIDRLTDEELIQAIDSRVVKAITANQDRPSSPADVASRIERAAATSELNSQAEPDPVD